LTETGGVKRLHAVVEGSVQGVGFRGYVLEKAQLLSLTGWVRNCWNGNVEVLAEGPQLSLENLLEGLKKGPSMSHVTNVQIEWSTATGEFSSFFVARNN
jgi:acylphosphatase